MALPLSDFIGILAGLPQWALALSETLEALPAAVLCVVTCASRVGEDKRNLLYAAVPVAAALLVAEGLWCAANDWSTWVFAVADAVVLAPLLLWAASLTLGQVAFVVMTNVFVAIDIVYFAAIVDANVAGNVLSKTYLAWPGQLTQWVLWGVSLPFLWHAARDAMPHALASPVVGPRVWRTLWIMPALLTCAVQLLRPGDVTVYWIDRVFWSAIAFMAIVSALALMVYLQMWRVVRLAEQAFKAERELRSVEVAEAQMAHLNERVEAARRERHDLRHHAHALQGLLDCGDVAATRAYLGELAEDLRVEDAPIRYCDNVAINTALVYYCDAARAVGARVDVAARVGTEPTQRESDITTVVFNLLENALDALREQAEAGGTAGTGTLRIRIEERTTGDQPAGLFVTVDNSCLPARARMENGEFVSSKPGSHGLGLQSVRQTAERTGGVARFELDGNVFRASVMLGSGR